MLLKISAVCLGAIALTTSVDAADPQSVLDCEVFPTKSNSKTFSLDTLLNLPLFRLNFDLLVFVW